jgi:hypothetical protein
MKTPPPAASTATPATLDPMVTGKIAYKPVGLLRGAAAAAVSGLVFKQVSHH